MSKLTLLVLCCVLACVSCRKDTTARPGEPALEGAELLAEGEPQLSVVLGQLSRVVVVQMPEKVQIAAGRAPAGTLLLVDQANGVWIGSWQAARGPLPRGKSYQVLAFKE